MRKLLIHIKNSVKLISLAVLGTLLIIGAIAFFYKPTYSVSLNDEFIGYTNNKKDLQEQINDYIDHGETENTAFVQVDNLPEYKLCLLKKEVCTNDEEIYNKVKQTGVAYYKYYAILQNNEEKLYVATFEEAESAVNGLKDKNSANKESITILEKYDKEQKDIITSEEVISKLYEEPKKQVVVKNTTSTDKKVSIAGASVNTGKAVNLGMSIIRPIQGTVTSRFGQRWGRGHKGLDIGAPTGTKIKAVAGGTVIKSGTTSDYGKIIVISHGNGVETYYAHCSALYAKAGQKVAQGEVIAAVGSTGRSTGSHLHLEIRVNGVAQNPQNYLY